MKLKSTIAGILTALILSGGTILVLAQSSPDQGPGRNGRGYGGRPASEQERAVRQQACPRQIDGVCPEDGPRGPGLGYCGGQGQGGYGYGRGLRNGTGPRAKSGTCPLASPKQAQ